MKFKVAVVQFEINHLKPAENLKKAEQFIKKASGRSDIIVFPEDFITGPIKYDQSFADSNKKYLEIFTNLAKNYQIDIVPGTIIEKQNNGLFNNTYYIDKFGKVKGYYHKINLWLSEKSYIQSGNKLSVFNTEFGKVGLIICWDLVNPLIIRNMAKIGVKIIFCPSYWSILDDKIGQKYDPEYEIKHVNGLCQARAFENNVILIYCNGVGEVLGGRKKGFILGRSQITTPFKGAVKRLDHGKEEMFIETLDTNILKDAEIVYKIRKDIHYGIF